MAGATAVKHKNFKVAGCPAKIQTGTPQIKLHNVTTTPLCSLIRTETNTLLATYIQVGYTAGKHKAKQLNSYLLPWFKMSGALPPRPHYAVITQRKCIFISLVMQQPENNVNNSTAPVVVLTS